METAQIMDRMDKNTLVKREDGLGTIPNNCMDPQF
jgi:hypothetical protein